MPRRPIVLMLILGIASATAWWFLVRSQESRPLDLGYPAEIEIPSPPTLEDTVPDVAPEPGVAAIPFDPAHDQPEGAPNLTPLQFDERLERSDADVAVRVTDARGRPLWRSALDSPDVKLWSVHGVYLQRERVTFDSSQHLIRPQPGFGLEPGRYVLTGSFGSYGSASLEFSLTRGQRFEGELRLPGFERVIALRLRDPSGTPIPYTTNTPRFEFRRTTPVKDLRSAPPVVLRSPAEREYVLHFSGSSASSSFSSSTPARNIKYLTDDGRLHVRVVAGVPGKVKFALSSAVFAGSPNRTFSSSFVGPEWDNFEVILIKKSNYEATLVNYVIRNPDDPGFLRLRTDQRELGPAAPSARSPLDVVVPTYRARLVFRPDSPTLRPLQTLGKNRWNALKRTLDDIYYTDLSAADGCRVLATDDRFYRVGARELNVPEGEVAEVPLQTRGRPCRLTVQSLPTLAAYARHVSFALSGSRVSPVFAGYDGAPQAAATREGLIHGYETTLSDTLVDALAGDATLWVAYGRTSAQSLAHEPSEASVRRGRVSFAVPLSERDRRDLVSGNLTLELASRLRAAPSTSPWIAFRCVGSRDEGVPFVEASLIPAEDEPLALRVREASRTLNQQNHRPQSGFLRAAYAAIAPPVDVVVDLPEEFEEAENPDDDNDAFAEFGNWTRQQFVDAPNPVPKLAELRKALPPHLIASYSEAGLERLWRQNAWYDTHQVLRSDRGGFVVDQVPLRPGTRYILYLWSRSRDDLAPDARVVFEATPFMTDLGVITVPSH